MNTTDLHGRIVLLTGAGSGIGGKTALLAGMSTSPTASRCAASPRPPHDDGGTHAPRCVVELGAEKAVSGYCRGIVDTECDRAEADVDLAVRQAAEWLDVYAIRRRVTDQLERVSGPVAEIGE